MAVETTALGFKKPDGNEPFRGGDNVISANAQTAEERHQEDRGRLGEAVADGPRVVAAGRHGGNEGPGHPIEARGLARLSRCHFPNFPVRRLFSQRSSWCAASWS